MNSVKIPLVFEEHQFASDCCLKSRYDKILYSRITSNDITLLARSIVEMSKNITKDDMKQENSEALFDP